MNLEFEISDDQNTITRKGCDHVFEANNGDLSVLSVFFSDCVNCTLNRKVSCEDVPCLSSERNDGKTGHFRIKTD